MVQSEIMDDEKRLRELLEETVYKTLSGIGFDVSKPIEIQKDIAYLNKIRKGSERLAGVIRSTTVGLVVTGLLYGFWEVLKMSVNK